MQVRVHAFDQSDLAPGGAPILSSITTTRLWARPLLVDGPLVKTGSTCGDPLSTGFATALASRRFWYDGPIHQVRRWVQELLGYFFHVVYRQIRMMADVDAFTRRYGPLITSI
jgi:hypothetical protein